MSAGMTDANLMNVNCTYADLSKVSFRKALLLRAKFKDAYLEGADLTTSRMLTQEMIEEAIGTASTRLSDRFLYPTHWLNAEATDEENDGFSSNWRQARRKSLRERKDVDEDIPF